MEQNFEQNPEKTKRLFVAIELPSNVAAELVRVQKELMAVVEGKFVPQVQMHVTLRFVGSVEEAVQQQIEDALGRVKFNPLHLKLGNIGMFADEGRPTVIWVSVEGGLVELAAQVNAFVEPIIGHPDKPFVPHATIIRIKHAPEHIAQQIAAIELKPMAFAVHEFLLKHSITHQEDVEYRTLQRFSA